MKGERRGGREREGGEGGQGKEKGGGERGREGQTFKIYFGISSLLPISLSLYLTISPSSFKIQTNYFLNLNWYILQLLHNFKEYMKYFGVG